MLGIVPEFLTISVLLDASLHVGREHYEARPIHRVERATKIKSDTFQNS
jgi:hypothetical protein